MKNTEFQFFLDGCEKLNSLRVLESFNTSEFVDFSSNDYLCFSKDRDLTEKAFIYSQKYGAGGGSSRLIAKNECYSEIESFMADIKKKESTLVFPSGYQVNSTIIPTLIYIFKNKYKKIDIFCDKLNHASIQHGIKLPGERQNRYKHQDLDQLEEMLKKSSNFKFVITETLFSMDGTLTDIKRLIELRKKYDFFLYIDDAHSFGIYGKNMLGITEGFENDIDVIMGTFSKSVGCQGGYLCADRVIVDALVNSATGFICSTAISPFLIGFAMEAIRKFKKMQEKVKDMIDLSNYSRNLLKNKIEVIGDSHIIPILDDQGKLTQIQNQLFEKKILTYIVKYPTVLSGKERIRLSLNISHKKEDIDKIYDIL